MTYPIHSLVHYPHTTICNGETFASELLEMFPLYYMHGDMFSKLKSSNTNKSGIKGSLHS